ncbi:MAG: phosphate uptake regulator PhoU [Candidatus Methanoplasma sp.]|jgi:phosphate uptake regulator|nr:phosphate uptake regulator PhoU [Candidatus Methanoplasma sp.]
MDTRRVQITGGSSYMVTLPKEWAASVGLRKNDPIGVRPNPDGSLVLYPKNVVPEARQTVKKIEVPESMDKDQLYRQLVGAYIAGHGSILVSSKKPLSIQAVDTVTSFTQTSIGFEVVEEDEARIVVKDLMDHAEMRPIRSIERMRVLVRNMLSDVFETAFTGDPSLVRDMESRDVEVDRIHWLVARQCSIYQKNASLLRNTDITLGQVTMCLSLSRVMERISDHAVLVSEFLVGIPKQSGAVDVDRRLQEIGKGILELFNSSVNGWMSRDIAAADRCIRAGEATVEMIRGLFGSDTGLDRDTLSASSLIASSSRRIAEYCMDISEMAINAAME